MRKPMASFINQGARRASTRPSRAKRGFRQATLGKGGKFRNTHKGLQRVSLKAMSPQKRIETFCKLDINTLSA